MRKLTTTAERRKRLQAKRTQRNVRSKEKATNWRRRLPLFIQAMKRKQEQEEQERALASLNKPSA